MRLPPEAEAADRAAIVAMLVATGGDVKKAAAKLGMHRNGLYRRIARHHIDVAAIREQAEAKPPAP